VSEVETEFVGSSSYFSQNSDCNTQAF